jgi:hypothetical protein
MIDICTVVFRDEIPVLRAQAQSVGLYGLGLSVRNIYVVVNDDETVIRDIDPAWWGPLAGCVVVVPRSAFSTPWSDNGWVSQQLWKLLAATMSYNVYTMILDAKTILVRPMLLTELIDQTGRIRSGRVPLYPVFEPSRQITQELFDITMTQQLGPGGVPFFLHNDTVRFMVAETTVRTRQSFPVWFQAQGRLTEFVLYSGYVQYRYQSLDSLYCPDTAVYPVNICHSEVDAFDRKIAEMQHPTTTSVSIHRRAWARLTAEQRTQFVMYLIDHNIVAGHDL